MTEENGTYKLSKYIDNQNMHALYERFILEYYKNHYPQFNSKASYIDWNIDNDFWEYLPQMKSDVTLEYKDRTIIIDAKFYTKIFQNNRLYDSKTFHSNNMYQIFAYVKNKDVNSTGNVSGILLYAQTDDEIIPNHDYILSGNKISIKSLDLNNDFFEIRKQLDNIANLLLDD